MQKKIKGIYKILCENNGKIYVGQSIDIYNRWRQHTWELNRQHHCNNILQNAWNLYGKDSFKFEVAEEVSGDKTELGLRELYWMDFYKSCTEGFNIAIDPTNGMFGRKHSEETKKKMSESSKGKKKSEEHCKHIGDAHRGLKQSEETRLRRIGWNHTEETKEQISKKLSGKILSEETKQRISDGKKGKRMKQEAIDKMRVTKTGMKQSEETVSRRSKSLLELHKQMSQDNKEKLRLAKAERVRGIMCIDSDGLIYTYSSVVECSDILGIRNSDIRRVLCGVRPTSKGFKFLYLN